MSKTTENYGLTKPEVGEFFSLETWNENMDKIDGELKKRENAQKESDNLLMNPKFTEAEERKNLTSGEKIHLMLGKISRFFSDMKAIAFSGSYNDLVDKPKIPTVLNNQTTTEEGYALDARQANPNIDGTLAKQLSDLNGSLNNVTKIYGSIKAGENLKMRDGTLFNAVYIFGKLVMISFSIYTTGDLQTGQILAELPESLQFKIEWNNLTGSMVSNGYCPFVFSDNSKYIYIRLDKTTVHANEEIRVWGIGFLNN